MLTAWHWHSCPWLIQQFSCNMTERPVCPIPNIFSSPPKLARTASSNKHQQSTEFQTQINDALMIARWQWKVAWCHPHCEVHCLAMHSVSFSHTHQLPFGWERDVGKFRLVPGLNWDTRTVGFPWENLFPTAQPASVRPSASTMPHLPLPTLFGNSFKTSALYIFLPPFSCDTSDTAVAQHCHSPLFWN